MNSQKHKRQQATSLVQVQKLPHIVCPAWSSILTTIQNTRCLQLIDELDPGHHRAVSTPYRVLLVHLDGAVPALPVEETALGRLGCGVHVPGGLEEVVNHIFVVYERVHLQML